MAKNNQNYYAVIPAPVLNDENLCDSAKVLYGELTSLSDAQGQSFASNEHFARRKNKSEKTISRMIKQLEDCGYIECDNIKTQGGTLRIILLVSAAEINKKFRKFKVSHGTDLSGAHGTNLSLARDKSVSGTGQICPVHNKEYKGKVIRVRDKSVPALADCVAFFQEKTLTASAEKFFNYYEAHGWPKGKWTALAQLWDSREKDFNSTNAATGSSGDKICKACGAAGEKYQMNSAREKTYLCVSCFATVKKMNFQNWTDCPQDRLAEILGVQHV